MNRKNKILLFNTIFITINICLFSFVLNFGNSFFETLCGIGVIIIDIITILAELIVLIATSKTETLENNINTKDLQTEEDFKSQLMKNMLKREFKKESEIAIKQMERLKKKMNVLDKMLAQHFIPGSLTYEKFSSTIINVENLFYDNLRKMIDKIFIFDQDEFNNTAIQNRIMTTVAQQERNTIVKEYTDYVNLMVQKNEEILIKLDNLMLEISKLEENEEISIQNIEVVENVDELIEQTKLYKQTQ